MTKLRTANDQIRDLIREELESFLNAYASGAAILAEDCNLISFEGREIPPHALSRIKALFKDVGFFVNNLSDDGITLCTDEPKDPLMAYIHQSLLFRRTIQNMDYTRPNPILLSAGIYKHCNDYIPFQLIPNTTLGYQDVYKEVIELLKSLSNVFCFDIRLDNEPLELTNSGATTDFDFVGRL